MRQRSSLRLALAAAAGVACLASGGAAFAQDEGWRDGRWQSGPSDHRRPEHAPRGEDTLPPPPGHARVAAAPLPNPGREAWLADCRQRVSARDNRLGGAVIDLDSPEPARFDEEDAAGFERLAKVLAPLF